MENKSSEKFFAIYLIRHAESEANAKNDVIGGHNLYTSLTKIGEEQAKKLGHHLLDEDITFDRVYTSTAIRTIETAKISLSVIKYPHSIIKTEKVLELDAGDFEGKSRNLYKDEKIRKKLDEDNWNFVPGFERKGESQKMAAMRMYRFIQETCLPFAKSQEKEVNIAIFTHGNAIKFLLAELFNTPRHLAYKKIIPNTSITCLKFTLDGKLIF